VSDFFEDGGGFSLEHSFIEKWAKLAEPTCFQIFIYVYSCFKETGEIPKISETSLKLCKPQNVVTVAYDFWADAGFLSTGPSGYFMK
jgi:hypothetical protein